MKEAYGEPTAFRKPSLALIAKCDSIVTEYIKQGFKLTIRQLYYQLVARGYVPNTVTSYDNVQNLMTQARLSGYIDWDAIEDRTRAFIDRSHWDSGSSILYGAARGYHEDLWQDQETRVFIVVEKEALAGVLERVCHEYDCPLLPARGYPSASTLREFAKERIMGASPQRVVLLHLGDHDPSGIDMTRDLVDRLTLFTREQVDIEFKRIALTREQIEEVKPPPNPAKQSDARFEAYVDAHPWVVSDGNAESWELDALSPTYLYTLIRNNVQEYIDPDLWNQRKQNIQRIKDRITKLADNFKD
jgi:hypothetical protein